MTFLAGQGEKVMNAGNVMHTMYQFIVGEKKCLSYAMALLINDET